MQLLFGQVLNMSFTAGIVILCVMAARLALKKALKIYSYALWSVVLFRLLCPVSLASDFSVLELTGPEVSQSEAVSYVTYVPVENVLVESSAAIPRLQTESIPVKELEQNQKDPAPNVMQIVSWVWMAGMGVMLLNSAVAYLRLYRNLIGAMLLKENIYLADHIASPFVLGTLFPKIYLPSDTPMEERRYIVAHERHHIRRGDHIIKLLAYGALCIHWFNPLVWIAFVLAGKDMEMSCDEAVIKKLGEHIRADYSASLLRLATHKKIISGTPLAFGEGDTKGRVKNMAKWKRPKVWVSIVCVLLCILVAAFCALNPDEDKSLKELTLMTGDNGSCSCSFGDLNYTLPGGISHWSEEREDFSREELKIIQKGQENRGMSVTVFAVGEEVFGGIQDHILPEGTDLTAPKSWMEHLDLWEWQEENLGYVGGSSKQADWEVEFFTDIPPGTEAEPVQRKHYFFLSTYGNRVFDLWFDMTVADPAIVKEILSSAYVGDAGRAKYKLEAPETLRLGDLQLTVPKGYGYIRTRDADLELLVHRYWSGNTTMGGVERHLIPEVSIEPPESWVKALGVTWDEAKDKYAITDKTPYGDLSLTVKNQQNGKNEAYTQHYFYIHGDNVYHIWFDELEIDDRKETEILDSIILWEFEAQSSTAQTPVSEEIAPEEALAKCRAVLDAVQQGSCQISVEHSGNGEYSQLYTKHQTSWLNVITVNMAGTEEKHAALFADGRYFHNMGKWSEEEIHWTEMKTQPSPLRPWLTNFDWKEESVVYMDTLTYIDALSDDSGQCIMLQIEEPYASQESQDHYFVNFIFDSEGSFIRTDITVNLFMEEEFTQTESIVTLNDLSVFSAINKEYQKAAGISLTDPNAQTAETEDAQARAAVEKCRAVLETIQSGSYHIALEKVRKEPQNVHSYSADCYRDGENWMNITHYTVGDGLEHHAGMCVNGTAYNNVGSWDGETIHWSEGKSDPVMPWCAAHQWNNDTAAYVSSAYSGGQEYITLLISEPVPAYSDSYLATFAFDADGSFVSVTLHAEVTRAGVVWTMEEVESIVTLDPETVAAKIDKEYRRAAG